MSLSRKVAIYVPSKIKSAKVPKLHRKFLKHVLTKFGVMFGGSTYVKGIGTYVSDDGTLVTEKVGIVYSFTDDATLAARTGEVFGLAAHVAGEMSQESVGVEIDGTFHFVSAPVPALSA